MARRGKLESRSRPRRAARLRRAVKVVVFVQRQSRGRVGSIPAVEPHQRGKTRVVRSGKLEYGALADAARAATEHGGAIQIACQVKRQTRGRQAAVRSVERHQRRQYRRWPGLRRACRRQAGRRQADKQGRGDRVIFAAVQLHVLLQSPSRYRRSRMPHVRMSARVRCRGGRRRRCSTAAKATLSAPMPKAGGAAVDAQVRLQAAS